MTDDEYAERGDYLASVSEDYHYAIHPDPKHPMTDGERQKAIEAYQSLISTQNQNTLNILEQNQPKSSAI